MVKKKNLYSLEDKLNTLNKCDQYYRDDNSVFAIINEL